jgi:hypothetical protein
MHTQQGQQIAESCARTLARQDDLVQQWRRR